MKKDGGTIENWQLHTLSDETRKVAIEQYGDNIGKILTGMVKEDPTGRWNPGMHMKSSVVVAFDGLTVETLNTKYRVVGPRGEKILPKGDLGDFVCGIFY